MTNAEKLEPIEQELVDAALAARKNSYSPYSNFAVGAAVLTKSEKIKTGCNVENASYGLAICAERTAICKAVSDGESEFTLIAVAATPLATPCGACRQFIAEFGGQIEIICVDAESPKNFKKWRADELLPARFEFK